MSRPCPYPSKHGVSATAAAMVLAVRGTPVQKNPLRRSDPSSPYCYSVDAYGSSLLLPEGGGGGPSSPSPPANFLATQVWPSARAAASALVSHADPSWTVVELGCGPGLPSLAFAAVATRASSGGRAVATDLDPFALDLVRAAATAQNFGPLSLSAEVHDLLAQDRDLPRGDLYVMSDVFEDGAVARGAALQTVRALRRQKRRVGTEGSEDSEARVWIFSQSDRAQREGYRSELIDLLRREKEEDDRQGGRMLGDVDWKGLDWSSEVDFVGGGRLLLVDVDETMVEYC